MPGTHRARGRRPRAAERCSSACAGRSRTSSPHTVSQLGEPRPPRSPLLVQGFLLAAAPLLPQHGHGLALLLEADVAPREHVDAAGARRSARLGHHRAAVRRTVQSDNHGTPGGLDPDVLADDRDRAPLVAHDRFGRGAGHRAAEFAQPACSEHEPDSRVRLAHQDLGQRARPPRRPAPACACPPAAKSTAMSFGNASSRRRPPARRETETLRTPAPAVVLRRRPTQLPPAPAANRPRPPRPVSTARPSAPPRLTAGSADEQRNDDRSARGGRSRTIRASSQRARPGSPEHDHNSHSLSHECEATTGRVASADAHGVEHDRTCRSRRRENVPENRAPWGCIHVPDARLPRESAQHTGPITLADPSARRTETARARRTHPRAAGRTRGLSRSRRRSRSGRNAGTCELAWAHPRPSVPVAP